MNTSKNSDAQLARAVAQGATRSGDYAPNLAPSAALRQAADELELVAIACRRSGTTKARPIIGHLFRIQERLKLAMGLAGGEWATPAIEALGIVIDGLSTADPVGPGCRVALRGLMRECRIVSRRWADGGAYDDDADVEAAQ